MFSLLTGSVEAKQAAMHSASANATSGNIQYVNAALLSHIHNITGPSSGNIDLYSRTTYALRDRTNILWDKQTEK